jgi:Glycosyl hydrolases family 43
MPDRRQRRDQRRRVLVAVATAVAFLGALAALGATVATDVQAHARSRHENAELTATRATLSTNRSGLAHTSFAVSATTKHEDALRSAISSMSTRLSKGEQELSYNNADLLFQGANIGTLEDCLGGVQRSFQQIAGNNNQQAAEDISAVSSSCLSLTGQSNGGLVYPFDFPDPYVVLVNGTYFAYATNSVAGNIQIIKSTDLTHWTAVGNALPNLPSWAAPDATWAPGVAYIGYAYRLYYAAVVAGPAGGEECISVATASAPQGPFADTSTAPLECQPTLGGSIDPSPFIDSNGNVYLTWKSNGGTGPTTIWSQQLDANGTGFAANTTPTQLLVSDQSWEAGVVEAPDLVTSGGRYYLFFSGNNWNSANYGIGVAICSGPLGPCSEPQSQPILASTSNIQGPGGEDVFVDASGSFWIAFHAYTGGAVGYPNSRDLYLRKLDLTGAVPVVEPAG